MCVIFYLCYNAKIKKYVLFKNFLQKCIAFCFECDMIQSNETNTHCCCAIANTINKCIKKMIKNFLLNNTNFNENDVNCIIEKLNKKSMQIYIEMSKNNYCEKINQIDVTLYCNRCEFENNIYVQFTINYLNCNTNKNMFEIKCFLIDCECDVCIVDDELIFSHLIKILMNTNNCNFIDVENINFNLIK